MGSRGLLYIDEGMDTEPETPTLLRHVPLSEFGKEDSEKQMKHPGEEVQLEISEEGQQDPSIFEAEERQRIVKSDDENEFVIVDDVNITESIPEIQLIEGRSDTEKTDDQAEPDTIAKEQEEKEEEEEKEAEKPVPQEEETPPEMTTTDCEVVPEALSKTEEGEPKEAEIQEVQDEAGDVAIEEPVVKKEAIIHDMVGPEQVPECSLKIEEPQAKEADAVPSGSLKIEETVAEIERVDDGSLDLQEEDQPEPEEAITPEPASESEPPPPESSEDAQDVKVEGEIPEGKDITGIKERDSSSSSSSDKEADEDFDDFPPPPPPPPLEITEESAPGERAQGSVSSSDDDFVEVRPERENVQDAQRMSSQVTSNPPESDVRNSGAEVEARIDLQKYYLKKKASNPPALPPKGKHNK